MRPLLILLCLAACSPEVPCSDAEDVRLWSPTATNAMCAPVFDACSRASALACSLGVSGSVHLARDFLSVKPATLNVIATVAQPCPGTLIRLESGKSSQTGPAPVLRLDMQAMQLKTVTATLSGACSAMQVRLMTYYD
jgi:hypothetical protein